MTQNNNYVIASSDLPASEDSFGIKNYIASMADFLMTCATPLTVSIQGSWGTGKTSIMKMIEKELDKDKCSFVEFNTWQFSQFNMESNLSETLIKSLIAKIDPEKGKSKNMNALFTTLSVIKYAGMPIVEKATGLGSFGELFKTAMDAVSKQMGGADPANPVNIMNKIKEEFTKSVNENPKERIIIFIDDLDRLEPRKAVELLEVLKNFLDCEKCVFVLAIDYDVVCRGVAEKYNFDFKDPVNYKKGKDFFDKIIQVPFKMPVEQYNIESYLEKQLTAVVVDGKPVIDGNDNIAIYEGLVRNSIGTNPRAIKRLKNSYQLLCMIVSRNHDLDLKECKLLIFATLCLQELDYSVYKAIVQVKDDLSPEMLQCLCDIDSNLERVMEYYPDIDFKKIDKPRVEAFISGLIDVLDTNKDDPLSKPELVPLIKVMKIASITGTDAPQAEGKKQRTAYTYDGKIYEKQGAGLKLYDLMWDLIVNEVIDESWNYQQLHDYIVDLSRKAKCKWISSRMLVRDVEKKEDWLMERPIELSDGTKVYLYRWWPSNDIDKFLNALSITGKVVECEKVGE
ncbi:KAP P-loop domain-containing protein (plasmid) [Butyrivibrio proteoclasticus B316]|uniref:KAP P-loop domain-containing protein n=1 Tax=Butyrivibrio proteoclasticus (strain ATCC 51982 / DSM 14932 / B316) TaxID=515622 RepID=E0S531_BUTPB|nr:P-loop NTPase fold protein [Butyrivibrio proteoclasticus]ADL36513.1 KAP P-loop domain-containing protein [Butyrivibrio proteoclasticus B316]